MLVPAGNTGTETPDDRDNPRSHAIYMALEAIITFAGNARASSLRCAETRVYLAKSEDDMHEAPNGNIFGAVSEDLKYVSRGRYRGQRFGDIDRWLPCAMPPSLRQGADEGGAQ